MIHDESFGIVPLIYESAWNVLLVLHRAGSYWGFPKGHREEGESDLQAAQRELLEETGLRLVKVLHEPPFHETYQFRRGKDRIVKGVSYFPALVCGEIQLQTREVADAKWLTLPHALQQLTYEQARRVLQQVQEVLPP